MEKTRKLFNRSKNETDRDSLYSTDSIYNFINNNDVLYPIQDVKDMMLEQIIEDRKNPIIENRENPIIENGENPIIEEPVNNYSNTSAYMLENTHYCHYAFDQKKNILYTKEQEEYRNEVIFNYNHYRFGGSSMDPWLFVEHNNIDWPDYVTKLYYTRLTPKRDLVRLSYSSILYLNKLFKSQTFAPVLRLKHYPIYDLASRIMRQPMLEDIRNEFVNEKFISNQGNVEIIKNDGTIIRDFIDTEKNLEVYDLNDEQPTNVSFNSFFDYIPICFYPSFAKKKPQSLFFSNICFHKNGCHDYWCYTHNQNNICLLHRHEHKDRPLFELSDLDPAKIVDFYQLINN